MFKLEEEPARTWLAHVIAAHTTRGTPPGTGAHRPPIGADWNPVEAGEEGAVYLLVRGAQEAGVLIAPPGAEIDFEYSDDSDGGCYRFVLAVSAPAPLTLASYAQEMRKLGDRDATGAEAAMAILREAERAANQILRQLTEFIAATAAPSIPGAGCCAGPS